MTTTEHGDKLATISYFPGVTAPTSPGSEVVAPFELEAQPEGSAAAQPEVSAAPSAEQRAEQKAAKRAGNVSIAALTRRNMSRWELEKTLLSRELDEEVVAEELARLEAAGLIDDAALADTLVRTQHERKGLGKGALTAEMRRRHIDQESIDAALEQIDDDDEQARANEIAHKRAGQLSSYPLEVSKRRLTAFMMRKGYNSTIVRNAVDEALSGRSRGGASTVRFR